MELLMTDSVIKLVQNWAEKNNIKGGLEFLNRNKHPFKFLNDKYGEPLTEEKPAHTSIPAEFPGMKLKHT